jgi:cell division transport system permease protein
VERLKLIITESLRSLGANLSTTLAATLTVVIAMFLLGLSISLGTLLLSYGDYVKKQLLVEVFFCTQDTCASDATTAQMNAVAKRISSDKRVRKIEFVSKEKALEIMRERQPEAVAQLPTNPFPNKLRVIPKKGEYTEAVANALSNKPPGVEKVTFGEKETRTILSFAHALEIGFIVAVALLVIASTLLVGNTIRLSIFSRRREIEVMKLVGATNWFVRGPFMLEGIICGLIGAVSAAVLLLLGKVLIVSRLPEGLRSSGDVQALAFGLNAFTLIGAGLILGAAGSALTIRRFLRV